MNLANFSGADLRAFAANSTFVPRPVSCPEKARCAMFEWASLEPRCGTPDSALAEISTLRAHAAENNNGRVGAQSRLAAAQRAPQMNKPAPCSNRPNPDLHRSASCCDAASRKRTFKNLSQLQHTVWVTENYRDSLGPTFLGQPTTLTVTPPPRSEQDSEQ